MSVLHNDSRFVTCCRNKWNGKVILDGLCSTITHNMTTVYWFESIKSQIVVKWFNVTLNVTISACCLWFVSFQQKPIWIMGCPLMTKFWILSFGVCTLEDRPSVDVLSSFLCHVVVLYL